MRWARVAMWCALAGCTDTRLAATAPKGVDLSGHWTLNVADSDDATRLMQNQIAAANAAASANQGRRGGRGSLPAVPMGPSMPPVAVLDESLRWPGRDLTLTQSPEAITFRSEGIVRTCRPSALKAGGTGTRADRNGTSAGRDLPARGRGDAPAPRCGWDERSLVVRSGEAEEDSPPYQQRFGLSDDGQRLVEVVVFQGGRSNGFVASREWDRVATQ